MIGKIAFVLCSVIAVATAYGEETSRSGSVSGIITIVDSEGIPTGNYEDVVIFIDGIRNNLTEVTNEPVLKVSHQDKIFSPHVIPIVKGESLDFLNDDNIFHNVFSLSTPKRFDLGIYAFGMSKIVRFDQTGLVRLYCNIHPAMVSNVLILENNYFAKTSHDGAYEIQGIPDGDYVLRVWHEYSDEVRLPVTVSGGKPLEQNFTIEQTKRIPQHRNKFGMPYPQKY